MKKLILFCSFVLFVTVSFSQNNFVVDEKDICYCNDLNKRFTDTTYNGDNVRFINKTWNRFYKSKNEGGVDHLFIAYEHVEFTKEVYNDYFGKWVKERIDNIYEDNLYYRDTNGLCYKTFNIKKNNTYYRLVNNKYETYKDKVNIFDKYSPNIRYDERNHHIHLHSGYGSDSLVKIYRSKDNGFTWEFMVEPSNINTYKNKEYFNKTYKSHFMINDTLINDVHTWRTFFNKNVQLNFGGFQSYNSINGNEYKRFLPFGYVTFDDYKTVYTLEFEDLDFLQNYTENGYLSLGHEALTLKEDIYYLKIEKHDVSFYYKSYDAIHFLLYKRIVNGKVETFNK